MAELVNVDPIWPSNAAIFYGYMKLPSGYTNMNLNHSCGKYVSQKICKATLYKSKCPFVHLLASFIGRQDFLGR